MAKIRREAGCAPSGAPQEPTWTFGDDDVTRFLAKRAELKTRGAACNRSLDALWKDQNLQRFGAKRD